MSATGSQFSFIRQSLAAHFVTLPEHGIVKNFEPTLTQRLSVFWFCRVRGKCIAYGRPAHRRGSLFGVCGHCGGADRDWTPKRRLS